MQQIVRSPGAQADAIEIWAYIAEDNAPAADRLLARFDEAVRKIVLQPFIGKSVHEIAPGIRFMPVGSYLIFYRVVDRGVEIVRILHGARDIGADFFAE